MSTLTDRYVAAVTRRLPDGSREDVGRELRATIADTVDGRPPGTALEQAERGALEELGDPERLAARFSDAPQHLIGPTVYPHYLRVMRIVLVVVPAVATLLALLGIVLDEPATVGEGILRVLGAVATGFVQAAFWTTLVFAVMERVADEQLRAGAAPRWTVDRLEEEPGEREFPVAGSVVGIVGALVGATLLTMERLNPRIGESGASLFRPELWDLWMWWFAGLLVASALLEVAKVRVGHWTVPLAAVNLAIDLLVTVPLVWLLATGGLFDPAGTAALRDLLGWESGPVSLVGLAVVVAVAGGWSALAPFVAVARRHAAFPPTTA
ncbi:MAG TPA: hypothetical protein VES95_06145 [Dermatophilaceae bacterium]|nr:hypothetical protein [Dermatophilaceae bacterium]